MGQGQGEDFPLTTRHQGEPVSQQSSQSVSNSTLHPLNKPVNHILADKVSPSSPQKTNGEDLLVNKSNGNTSIEKLTDVNVKLSKSKDTVISQLHMMCSVELPRLSVDNLWDCQASKGMENDTLPNMLPFNDYINEDRHHHVNDVGVMSVLQNRSEETELTQNCFNETTLPSEESNSQSKSKRSKRTVASKQKRKTSINKCFSDDLKGSHGLAPPADSKIKFSKTSAQSTDPKVELSQSSSHRRSSRKKSERVPFQYLNPSKTSAVQKLDKRSKSHSCSDSIHEDSEKKTHFVGTDMKNTCLYSLAPNPKCFRNGMCNRSSAATAQMASSLEHLRGSQVSTKTIRTAQSQEHKRGDQYSWDMNTTRPPLNHLHSREDQFCMSCMSGHPALYPVMLVPVLIPWFSQLQVRQSSENGGREKCACASSYPTSFLSKFPGFPTCGASSFHPTLNASSLCHGCVHCMEPPANCCSCTHVSCYQSSEQQSKNPHSPSCSGNKRKYSEVGAFPQSTRVENRSSSQETPIKEEKKKQGRNQYSAGKNPKSRRGSSDKNLAKDKGASKGEIETCNDGQGQGDDPGIRSEANKVVADSSSLPGTCKNMTKVKNIQGTRYSKMPRLYPNNDLDIKSSCLGDMNQKAATTFEEVWDGLDHISLEASCNHVLSRKCNQGSYADDMSSADSCKDPQLGAMQDSLSQLSQNNSSLQYTGSPDQNAENINIQSSLSKDMEEGTSLQNALVEYVCSKCQAVFVSRELYLEHFSNCEKIPLLLEQKESTGVRMTHKIPRKRQRKLSLSNSKGNSDITSYTCLLCSRRCKGLRGLAAHQLRVHKNGLTDGKPSMYKITHKALVHSEESGVGNCTEDPVFDEGGSVKVEGTINDPSPTKKKFKM